jgi:hypothetical protein
MALRSRPAVKYQGLISLRSTLPWTFGDRCTIRRLPAILNALWPPPSSILLCSDRSEVSAQGYFGGRVALEVAVTGAGKAHDIGLL